MTKPRLTYFDFSGSRGEECRLALFVAGIDFEDRRIDGPRWAELKPTTPYGSLPILEDGDRPALAQSNAILGYVGRRSGLYPEDPWRAAIHDGILAAVEDLRAAMTVLAETETPETRRDGRRAFVSGPLHAWASALERQVRGPFVEGERLCVADLKLFVILTSIASGVYDHIDASALEPFPKLRALLEAVGSHPEVAQWRARHPR